MRNCLTELRGDGLIENTGEFEGRAHKVRSVTVTTPFSGDGDGDGRESSESGLFEERFK